MKKGSAMTANKLRYILISALILLFFASAAGFYFVQNLLRAYAKETSSLNSEAAICDQNLAALKNIESYLAAHQQDQDLAQKVVADSKEYRYQNEIVSDISDFADKSGIHITSYDFSSSKDGAAGSTSSTPSTSTTTTPSATPSGGAAAGTSSLKSTTVNVSIQSPVNYTKLLNFISLIEQNTTKMQISGISLTRSDEGGKSKVSSESFDIEVYVR